MEPEEKSNVLFTLDALIQKIKTEISDHSNRRCTHQKSPGSSGKATLALVGKSWGVLGRMHTNKGEYLRE